MLEIKNLSFKYNEKFVLQDINLVLNKGQHIAIIGESGCGKSTLLKLIYGLFEIKFGNIFWNNLHIKGPKNNLVPGEKNMKFVTQDFDLMRFHTVQENIGKFLSNQDDNQRKKRINQLLEMVEMTEFAMIQPRYLSGGQQQRIAIARALAQEPELLILDEPFSQIDNFRKNSLRRNLFSYLKEKNILCIIATHDFTDALSFSDQIIVMKQGKILEIDCPKKIYDQPKNKYIANLFDEVNEISSSYFYDLGENKNILIYPNEFIVVEYSLFEVEIVESYFKGNLYLVQAISKDGFVFFESKQEYFFGEKVYLTISSKTLEKRL